MEFLILATASLVLVNIILTFLLKSKAQGTKTEQWFREFEKGLYRIENGLKEDLRLNREEHNKALRENRQELSSTLKDFRSEMTEIIKSLTEQAKSDNLQLRDSIVKSFKDFQDTFDRNVHSFNELQREKFAQLEKKQSHLVESTEQRLDKMRETVDEKLQKTLNERLGKSFELVNKQLEGVQKGLGEMQTLAQDVGGLKKVLSNVKTRGTLGEIQLGNILEQIMAPDQYEGNVKTKQGSQEVVEFAVKLPGKNEHASSVYLPIDSKFPTEAYYSLQEAYESGDSMQVQLHSRNLETAIKKCAKDIRDKYIDPPYTTDFGIMFLPVEGLYAEVVRKTSLIEILQREYKIVLTGPTTLAAMLNSLQMGFKTLAIQKRSSEVWQILGAVKTEFGNFAGMLQKAKSNLDTASNQIDQVLGVRTRAIERKLKSVEALPSETAENLAGDDNVEKLFEEKNS